MRRFRLISQIFFFCVFLYLFFNTLIAQNFLTSEFEPIRGLIYIFAIDPFLGLMTILATGVVKKIFLLSLMVVLLTFLFGRFFCGFVCPMGSIMHFFSFIAYKIKGTNFLVENESNLKNIKYYILVILSFLALCKINLSGYLDPLSLLFKIFNIFILPIIYLLYSINILPNTIQDFLFYNIIGRETIYYKSTFIFGIIFFILIFLNFIKSRFWCKVICPLGAFFGLISSFSLFKITKSKSCKNCQKCTSICFATASPNSPSFKSNECMLLFNCLNLCKTNSIKYSFNVKPSKIDLSKRKTFKYLTLSAVSLITFKASFPLSNGKEFIRPPGALDEDDFLRKCIRCGACMKICPENFLTPSITKGGILELFTPVGNPEYGYCLYQCNLCGKVCPTGAIKRISLSEKQKIPIGLAYIDQNRCLAHAYNTNCAVCEEHCPVSPKAIYFEEQKVINKDGSSFTLKKPYVDLKSCIGCGLCQYKCPIEHESAILIMPLSDIH